MTGELKTALRIDATTSGKADVDALAKALVGIGVGADQAEEMAKGIAGEIDKLGPKKQAIKDLETAFRGLGMSEQEAAVAAKQTVSGLDEIAQGAGKVGDQSAKSALSVNDLTNQLAGMVTAGAILQFARDSVQAYGQAEASFRGLEAVAKHSGVTIGEAMDTANRIAADGLVSVADASKALQNLLSRGYKLDEAEATLGRLKDAAAFNRQANLALSDAVLSATEGLKNENSVLVDNAGVTKNVAKMWEEYAKQQGITTQEMTQAQKIQAEFNGIMAETEAQVGNAKKALEGYQGEMARSEQATRQFQEQLGQALVPATTGLAQDGTFVIENFLKPVIFLMQKSGIEVAKTAADFGSLYDAITSLDFSQLEAQLSAHVDLAEEELLRVAKGLDTNTIAIAEQAREQEKLGKAGKDAGEQVAEGQQQAAEQTNKTSDSAKQLADDLKRLKIDPEEFKSGMTSAEKALVDSFDRMVAKADASSDMLLVGFGEALQDVGVNGLAAFEFSIQEAFQKGRISVEQLDAAMQLVEVRRKELTSGAGELEAAYRQLGLTSQKDLQAVADKMKAAYETLVRMGAPIADLNAAWAKYAEAAIAANGGVADATVQADARMRGYIITVDDAGKATVRLASVTKDFGVAAEQALDRARRAAQDAAAATAQASIDMYHSTSGGIGGMQDSIDEFHQHLQGLGGALAYHINLTRRAVFDATNGSVEAMRLFNELAKGGAMQTHWLGDAVAAYYKAMDTVIGRYNDQMRVANHLIAGLRAANEDGAALSQSILTGAYSVDLLDSATLANLRAEIDAAHQRIKDFGSDVGDTVANLREQLAEERGEYAKLEEARGDARMADLRAQLKDAQDALDKSRGIFGKGPGDPTLVKAVADLQKAIKLQEELNLLREEDAKQREEEAKQRQQQQTAPTPTPAPTPTQAPSLPAPATSGGGPVNLYFQGPVFDAESLAREILPALEKIWRLRR